MQIDGSSPRPLFQWGKWGSMKVSNFHKVKGSSETHVLSVELVGRGDLRANGSLNYQVIPSCWFPSQFWARSYPRGQSHSFRVLLCSLVTKCSSHVSGQNWNLLPSHSPEISRSWQVNETGLGNQSSGGLSLHQRPPWSPLPPCLTHTHFWDGGSQVGPAFAQNWPVGIFFIFI